MLLSNFWSRFLEGGVSTSKSEWVSELRVGEREAGAAHWQHNNETHSSITCHVTQSLDQVQKNVSIRHVKTLDTITL